MKKSHPESVAQVSDILRDASERAKRVAPIGGGTHMAFGHQPESSDILLHTGQLNQVAQYEPEDMTISVQAGMSAAALSSLLAEHRCRLPLDVDRPSEATIGGMTAVGWIGPRRFGLGTLRDHLIGARAVLADGTVIKTGGMVVKNVSGYDMTKLLHGSMGSLGVIVEVNFKLLPLPAFAIASTYDMPGSRRAVQAAQMLLAARLPFTALQARSDGALIVGCEGHRADVERMRAAARDVANQAGGRERETSDGEAETALAWQRYIGASSAARGVTFRAATLPSRIWSVAEEAESASRSLGFEPAWRADVGCGMLELSVEVGDAAERLAELERSLIETFGAVRVLNCPEDLRSGLTLFGRPPRGLALMHALKSQFDPNGVLNVGANVGGI